MVPAMFVPATAFIVAFFFTIVIAVAIVVAAAIAVVVIIKEFFNVAEIFVNFVDFFLKNSNLILEVSN